MSEAPLSSTGGIGGGGGVASFGGMTSGSAGVGSGSSSFFCLALPFVLPFFPGDFFVFVSFGLPVNIYQENLPQWPQ